MYRIVSYHSLSITFLLFLRIYIPHPNQQPVALLSPISSTQPKQSGQSCDAITLWPWNYDKYRSPSGYSPQDPNDFGGPSLYGEKLWVTAAIMNIDQGSNDGCCGSTSEGGCGNCILIQNPDSLHPDWSVMAMKKVCSFLVPFSFKETASVCVSFLLF